MGHPTNNAAMAVTAALRRHGRGQPSTVWRTERGRWIVAGRHYVPRESAQLLGRTEDGPEVGVGPLFKFDKHARVGG